MPIAVNHLVIAGNLTRDPDVKYLQSGTAVCEIGLAINERRKDNSGEWTDDTTFVEVTLWGRTAEVAGEYLHKGDPVLILGKLKFDQWEKDGQRFSKLRVTAERMQLLGGQRRDPESQERPARRDEHSQIAPPDEDSIPF